MPGRWHALPLADTASAGQRVARTPLVDHRTPDDHQDDEHHRYGLQTWSFWQDKSQLEMLYPNDWRTMINNCRVLQCFGALNMNAARDVAELTGFDNPNAVMDLNADEMVLQLAGDEAVVARLPNYLDDEPFAGQFDTNPFYDKSQSILPAAHPLANASLAGAWRKKSLEDGRDSVPLPQGDPDTMLARLLRDYDAGSRSVSG